MARPKARYRGDGADVLTPDFNVEVRRDLRLLLRRYFGSDEMASARAFMRGFDEKADWRQAQPEDGLIGRLLSDSYELKVRVAERSDRDLTKGELVAEYSDLLRSLKRARTKLGSMSLDLQRVLRIDPEVHVDTEQHLVSVTRAIERAGPAVRAAVPYQRAAVFEEAIKTQLVALVVDCLVSEGLPISGRETPLYKVLMRIGKALDIDRAEKTWRNAVWQFRQSEPKPPRSSRQDF